ncbi:MAG: hypothetical protein IJU41_06865 [Clostridia bacterium]|nr:hypothetical protein [Clostridia bacterium]
MKFFRLLLSVLLCLVCLAACGRADGGDFARYRGDLSADVRYTLRGVPFAARYTRENGRVTLTFTEPRGLCGCALARTDGEVSLLRGDLSVPVRGEAALPCAIFDFTFLAPQKAAEGYVFCKDGATYTVLAPGGGVSAVTLERAGARLSFTVDDISF